MLSQVESDALVAERDSLVAVDGDGTFVFANAAALTLLQHADLIGRPLETIVPERLRDAHRSGFARYRDTGRSRLRGRTIRVPALLGNGTERDVDLTLRFFRRPDGSLLAVGALRPDHVGVAPDSLVGIEEVLRDRDYEALP